MRKVFDINKICNNYKKSVIFLILGWISLWLSIDTYINFGQIDNLLINKVELFNNVRVLIFFITFFFSVCLILFLIIKKKIWVKEKINNILLILFFYFILQIIGLQQNPEVKFNLENLYLVILAIGALNIFFIINLLQLEKILKYILYSSIVILALFLFVITLSKINNSSTYDQTFVFNFYSLFHPQETLLNREYPRVTGISRMLAVVNLSLIIFLDFNNKIKSALLLFIITIFSVLIWGMQSRGTIICFFISLVIICFFLKNLNFKNALILLFILSFVPAIIFEYARPIIFKKNIENYIKYENEKNKGGYNGYNIKTDEIRLFEAKHTSGRVDLWKEVISKYDKSKLFGYGPQADRLLLYKTDLSYKYSTNVSNGVLYAFLCGGYLSVLIFFFIYYKIYTYVDYFYNKKKILNKIDKSVKISITLLIFFSFRSLVENSFTLFSVDFLLFLISINVVDNFIKKNNSNKFNFS